MSRRADPGRLLVRALSRDGAAALVSRRPWASATFQGERHCLTIRAADTAAAARLCEELPDRDFVLPGHLVADIAARAAATDDALVEVEALTIEVD